MRGGPAGLIIDKLHVSDRGRSGDGRLMLSSLAFCNHAGMQPSSGYCVAVMQSDACNRAPQLLGENNQRLSYE
jgi:hypothetical protein